MLKAVYGRIKDADPQAQVVIGGILMACEYQVRCNWPGSRFLEGILINGGKDSFDIVAYHGYDDYDGILGHYSNYGWSSEWNDEGPSLINKARFIKSVLAKYNASNKAIMATEVALRCADYPNNNPPSYPCSTNLADFWPTKNAYIAQAYAAAIVEGLQVASWYDLSGTWMNTALLDPNQQYTDAFFAYLTARESLQGAVNGHQINNYPGVKGYEFTRGGRTVWLIWSGDGATHAITLPSKPASARDVLGTPVSVPGTSLSVSLTPTYLEW
jgi:hypothetical protein